MLFNPIFAIDGYKADHRSQYPKGTNLVYSNFTPRVSRVKGVDKMVFFGLQYLLKEYFIERFQREFFFQPKGKVLKEYQDLMDCYLGPKAITVDHIGELWDYGKLPIVVKALPEGTAVPMGTPCMVLYNSDPRFFWLVNYLETLISSVLWKGSTSATTANEFRKNFAYYADASGGDMKMVPWQGHDFSFRGMSCTEDACLSGAAHLLSFTGTDTIPAILFLEKYYNANRHKELIGGSVPATEHSVMSAGGDDNEFLTYKRLINEVYPNGIVSVVSDTWDFWNVVTDFLPRLKDDIMRRNGKLVIRPDSGVPHKIICGDPDATSEPEKKGLVRCLWDIFGGTKGFAHRQLDPHIGFIYGDSINLEEQVRILSGLTRSGFSTTCGVLGIGSYTYQYVTRDTYGTVCKATYCEVDGQPREIFKAPKTGGWKKSHRGLLRVNPDLTTYQQVSWAEEGGELTEVFRDGIITREASLSEIRARIQR